MELRDVMEMRDTLNTFLTKRQRKMLAPATAAEQLKQHWLKKSFKDSLQ